MARSFARFSLNSCENLGVETGTLMHWDGEFGFWSADTIKGDVIIDQENKGISSIQHRIRSVADGRLPEITAEVIPFVPPGSKHAIQLGNSINGRGFERLVTSFVVDSVNSLFQYQFAVVFQNPDHKPVEQPKFEILVTDQYGETVPCGFYQVTAANNLLGFKSQGDLRYRNWTTAAVDLRSYIGQIVTIRISTYDCSQGGHWGMALFDANCLSAEIKASNFCPGVDNSITLEAPLGFQNYRWSNGMTGRIITLTNITKGENLTVEFSPFSSLNDACKLSLSYTVPANIQLILPDELSFCRGGQVDIMPSVKGENDYRYRWLPNGDTTKNIVAKKAGVYIVEAVRGNCTLRDTVTVRDLAPPEIAIAAKNPACAGRNDGELIGEATYPTPVLFRWNTQATTTTIRGLSAGVYTVTVTGAITGCTATATRTLTQAADGISAKATLKRYPGCDNWGDGSAEVVAKGGTLPYSYRWSTGATEPATSLKTGGAFAVTITDANGCQGSDSLRVRPLEGLVETEGNNCHGGREGVIEISGAGGIPPYLYQMMGAGNPGDISVFSKLATGTYALYITDQTGCKKMVPAEVKNLQTKAFAIDLPADTTVAMGTMLKLRPSSNYPIKSVSWTIPNQTDNYREVELEFQALKSCRVKVTARDAYGCVSEADMALMVNRKRGLYIPNVFTPLRPDSDNTHFYVSANPEQVKQMPMLRIYDRWGNMVFERPDYKPNALESGWDGNFNGKEALPGVYVYQLNVEFIDGEKETFTGDVTLVR